MGREEGRRGPVGRKNVRSSLVSCFLQKLAICNGSKLTAGYRHRPSRPVTCEHDLTMSTTIPPVKLGEDLFVNTDPHCTRARWKGTRTATVIIVMDSGETTYVERDIWVIGQDGEPKKGEGERRFKFVGEKR